jgi:hypothetical protein
MRASYHNQARIHNGYHYPRSFTTAYRSRVNLPRFVRDYAPAVRRDFTKLYAIARRNSKVAARQFEHFCTQIGASLVPASTAYSALFERRLIEAVYQVDEYAFDADRLRAQAHAAIVRAGIHLELSSEVLSAAAGPGGSIDVEVERAGERRRLRVRYVFSCTYSGIGRLRDARPEAAFKHEITEMALVAVPKILERVGITLMDGPFFSCMPFPARGLHTLSHVRYTPHRQWLDEAGVDPYARLAAHGRDSRFPRMVRDAARYVPLLAQARHMDSLYEVKTVLTKNEGDDGRPILFERSGNLPGLHFILGGKIDNIYDVLERLDQERFS